MRSSPTKVASHPRRPSHRSAAFLVGVLVCIAGRVAFAYDAHAEVLEVARKGVFPGGHLLIEAERVGQTVRVDVANAYNTPVTVAFAFTLDNLEPVAVPETLTVPAAGHALAGTFRVSKPKERYSYHYTLHWLFGAPGSRAADTLYDLPYSSGARFRVMQGNYGEFSHRDLAAIDWSMPEGTPVCAARAGVVVSYNDGAQTNGLTPDFLNLDKANWVILRHDDGTLGCYFHLSPGGVRVKPGQQVARDQLIGMSGNTGYSTGPHLHFEVRAPIDAKRYRTFPVRFRTASTDAEGEIPLEGRSYSAP